jgi:lysophospholipase L1-like esterase
MKRRYRKLMAMFAAAFMLFSFTFASVSASAATTINYVALGDSVTYGLSAYNRYGYAAMLRDYIDSTYDVNFLNAGVEGLDTGTLLLQLSSQESNPYINLVTINIGSNNLLRYVLPAVVDAFGGTYVSDLNTNMSYLYNKIRSMSYEDAMATYASMDDPGEGLPAAFKAGIQEFKEKFPLVISHVKRVAPNARIIVNNLYNPIQSGDPLYKFINSSIVKINDMINRGAASGGYSIANSYLAFKAYETTRLAVTFSARNAIIAAKLGNFNLFVVSLDPHPTTFGHTLIFDRERNLLK